MYSFSLYNPTKVYYGKDERRHIGEEVSQYGKRVLVVYGSDRIKRNGLFDEIKGCLAEQDCTTVELGGIRSNPHSEDVDRGTKLCRESKIDVIVAIGGGSVIDCAKAVSVCIGYEGDSWDVITKKVIADNSIPVIAVVTVSGTGTEMNNSCVISNVECKAKRGFTDDHLRPRAAFLDPELTFSVNAFQTACGAFDTLSHVLDTAYMIKQGKMPMLNDVMEAICRTVIHYAPIAVSDPLNYEARANLMWASTWGLNGFLKNGVRQLAACHAIEHELSAYYDINHGLGMAVVMPRYYDHIIDAENAYIFQRFGEQVFDVAPGQEPVAAAKETIKRLKDYAYIDLGLPSTLSELGIDDTDFAEMANNICWGGTLPGMKLLSTEDVINIFYSCL